MYSLIIYQVVLDGSVVLNVLTQRKINLKDRIVISLFDLINWSLNSIDKIIIFII